MSAIPGTPNHPLVKVMEHEWHKVAAMIMAKFGMTHIEITLKEIERMTAASEEEMPTIIVQAKDRALHVRLMPMREAKAFVALHETGDV